MSDEDNSGAVVSNKSLHSPQSAILAIVNMINYLEPEVVLVDSNAGQLLQMCKAELLQTLALEATASVLRHGGAQNNATFASLSQAYSSDAARKITMAKTARDDALSIARHINQARLDIAANRVKERTSFVKELARGHKSRANRNFPVISPLRRLVVDAMGAVAAADPAPRHRPSPRQSSWPRGVATGTASFDKGAWRLLSGMIALVHQGEMVIRAGPAATFRRMMGGSSGVARTVYGHHFLASRVPTAVSLPC